MNHLAVVFGDIRDGEVPVRLHPEEVTTDVFGTSRRLDGIMKTMGEQKRGVAVYLRGLGRRWSPGTRPPRRG